MPSGIRSTPQTESGRSPAASGQRRIGIAGDRQAVFHQLTGDAARREFRDREDLPLNSRPPARACAAAQAASIAGSSVGGTATVPGSSSTAMSGGTGLA